MEKSRRQPVASGEEPSSRCVVHDVPDDLLRLILLLLDSPLWLVRAACACKRWRRVVVVDGADGGRAFLRLARSLHPPVVVGHYHSYHRGGYRFVPSSPTPTPIARRLSLDHDFFPRELAIDRWHVADCHGGLVLLRDGFGRVSSDLVVCDPLSRHYRDIHHPPPDQTCTCLPMGTYMTRVFLLDGGDDDEGNISISNFRVLLYHSCSDDVTKVYIFSAADGRDWRLVRQSTAASDDRFVGSCSYMGHVIGRIDRSLYMASSAGSVTVLDNTRLVFSEVDLPIRVCKSSCLGYGYNYSSTFAVVHGASPDPAASSPATASIVHVRGEALELFRRRVPSSGEWVLEHSIPRLSEAARGLPGYPELSRWKAVSVIAGGTRLAVLKVSLSRGNRSWSWLLSLDVDTMQLQVVPDVDTYLSVEMKRITYTLPWPQFLMTAPS